MRKKSVSFILKRDQFCQFSFLSPVYAALNQRVTFMENTPFKKECSRKEKLSMVIVTNLISICCVYKEKIVKND